MKKGEITIINKKFKDSKVEMSKDLYENLYLHTMMDSDEDFLWDENEEYDDNGEEIIYLEGERKKMLQLTIEECNFLLKKYHKDFFDREYIGWLQNSYNHFINPND